jgi:two-component system capsular synthesis response regulator RcsB
MNPVRVILADDHPVILVGLKDYLEKNRGFEVIATANSSTCLMQALAAHVPDVIVTDYSMPDDLHYGDGIRFISYLVNSFPAIKVVVLTMVFHPKIVRALYRAGVHAVVLKTFDMEDIATAIGLALKGENYRSSAMDEWPAAGGKASLDDDRINSLTLTELEVLRHFLRGASVTQIGQSLHRSVKTVSGHKALAMKKLGVRTDQELIAFCVNHGLFNY